MFWLHYLTPPLILQAHWSHWRPESRTRS